MKLEYSVMKADYVNIGTAIERRVEDLHISKSELARRIGIASQNINRIFSCPSIDTDRLVSICNALDYDFFSLFIEDGDKRASHDHSAVVTAANSLAINGDHNMVPDPNAISGSELYKTQLYLTQQLLAEKDKQLAEKERTIELLQKLLESK